jgi:ferric-dicitrate binding protein FerR (iron transport regulator)
MKSDNVNDEDTNDGAIEILLREVGGRDEPSQEMMLAVRAAAHAEWQSVVSARTQHKRTMSYSLAAGVVLTIGAALLLTRFVGRDSPVAEQPALVATIGKIHSEIQSGVAQVSRDDGKTWHDATTGEALNSGMLLRTDTTTKMALDFGNELQLRVDVGSQFKLTALGKVNWIRGRFYVDGSPSQHVPLTVQTKFGAIEHLGTQYQALLSEAKLIVSVREGQIAYTPPVHAANDSPIRANAGERVEFNERGGVTRNAIPADDESWQWIAQIAPAFSIDNQSLVKFLEWVARETGQSIRYASPEVRAEAEQVILRGSVSGLTPDQALNAVLSTTPFVRVNTAAGIEIGK